MKREIIITGIIAVSMHFVSCSTEMTKEEMQVVEMYTVKEKHDAEILGEWIENTSKNNEETIHTKHIYFDAKGVKKERLYKGTTPFNDWHQNGYYFTKNNKIYSFKPAEKGFLAMDGALYKESAYQFSENKQTLTLGEKIYKRVR